MDSKSLGRSILIKNPLLKEIIDLIKSGKLFSGNGSRARGFLKIYDINLAKDHCWEKFYTKNEYTWSNIISKEIGKVFSIRYNNPNEEEIELGITNISDEINYQVALNLNKSFYDLIDDVTSVLSYIGIARLLEGDKNIFFEKIFEAYKSGGWPCGWEGELPEGNPIVFYPPENLKS